MSADFSELRVKMVDGQIRTTDVTSTPLLDAMLSVPRELFVDERQRNLAYIDEDIRIADGPGGARYLMEPSPLAKLMQLAEISQADSVLDVGCGTGYASAILSRLAGSVVALESDSALAETAKSVLSSLGCGNVTVVQGPLPQGYAAKAPYDVVFVGGSVGKVPAALLDQLAEGGRLVAVEGQGNSGVARLFFKAGGVVTGRRAFNAAIKPLPGFEREHAFEF
ncbi:MULTISPECIES: protein-L-isoaspartate O-methyltransferase family protein [unclassified Mesorhizobium]|uniref:protein-L-isoaspartate O-methyltransferase family protein n=1 Tax=unclassified Mesorhizobium TaxID=325217 RepID=UPI0011297975|nr:MULTISPECIES: protein-L-isoaspartate O-methyltransferase [unclassified Mesorhizobium]TPJ44541.1 protein-L-isoaspartate O-methyltransferase [Mesorhizobium sp. B2-6-6]MBZ9700459.1 protein-L-isoaspartate O-methyltransferase [Mesorhizobium sp. CO1-1-3]MBZ9895168.1 protein-L-isoaspartate O-methyltransferase [Mesorhizobium sp. BR1-1-6]MBZ9919700.1 protein-L-isoaspartate O-methyltransferase [Mesorhizobium sp. BR1-1-7]MBZ9946395.1 protein-L-isoaspartate O-methyltransferase [Mesorhizobium sp. BR1-1-